ncbi:MAG: hypothetical protein SOW37_03240 [Fusobacterium perfoetens]|uniref:hypothetical protein n=1 Tax=Fusobacterium perfoetens TaxID=852 RepID=UPI002A75DBD2|nr:hypothetical protein [Fusobacterium perfoetens]MDY3237136.1 hypothetical protein [Fusobacterium perfoetens]
MKKLALLLAAVGMVSAVAYAAPELTVTSIGQEIESENTSNGADLDEVTLYNRVGLAYGDWTFGLEAGKRWAINFDDTKDVHSINHRLQIDVWKKINEDLKLGFRYRGQREYDRYYARWDWNHGLLWSAGDVWYEANNESGVVGISAADYIKGEVYPIGFKYGTFKVGYFVEFHELVGSKEAEQKENYLEQQIRAYWTFYKGEKLTLSTEGRFTITADEDHNGKVAAGYRVYDDFGRNRLYIKANYAVNENLSVYGSYGYEMRDWKMEDGHKDDYTKKYWQDVIVGWSYKF